MKLAGPGRLEPFTRFGLTHCRYYTMPRNNKKRNTNYNRLPRDKKPQLTHFLCLPLVNSISLPQLESSLAAFKAAIPSLPHDQNEARYKVLGEKRNPLIPDGALRPLGTLHLTLGVMSLPTKERLEEALEYFQSLDLAAMMREAENKAERLQPGRPEQLPSSNESSNPPQSFNVSLESLYALPRARSATILHAAPVDPTSRLYPFCEILRDKFLEAGFMVGESKGSHQPQPQVEGVDQRTTEGRPHQEANDTKSTHTPPISKPRQLLLHATVVNTIYVKGRRGPSNASGNNHDRKKKDRYTIDARDMIGHYRDYYLDHTRTTPRSTVIVPGRSRETPIPPSDAVNSEILTEEESSDDDNNSGQDQKRPFVWARDFPLDSVCICEMGAKKLDPKDTSGVNARLGEKYQVVAERSLLERSDGSLTITTDTPVHE